MGILNKLLKKENIKNEVVETTPVPAQRPVITLNQFLNQCIVGIDKEPTFLNCLKYRSESLGKMPIKLVKKDNNGVVEQTNNNLYYLLFTRPNKQEDATTFWNAVEKERLLYGTSYVYIQRDNKGNVVSLKRLKSQLVQVPMVDDPFYFGSELPYIYQSAKGAIKMTSEELLIFKNSILKPNQIEGEGSISLLRTILESNAYGNMAIANINKNGINAQVKVSVEENINEGLAQDIIKEALDNAKGVNSSGVIFQDAGIKIEPFNTKLNESDYLNIYKNNQCIILALFGISANMLNIEQSSGTYSNSETNMIHYLTNTMLSVTELYINELNYKLLTQNQIRKGYTFDFDTENILKVDYKTLVSTTTELVNTGILSIDEARKRVNHCSLPNGIGKVNLVNGCYVKLEDVGIAYQKDMTTDAS